MKTLLKQLVALCCGSALVIGLETNALAHGSHDAKKKRSRTHKHSHDDHGHGHDHSHSPFSLGLGMSISKAFQEEHAEEEGHTHLTEGLGLHGGHGGGGAPGEESGEPDGQPYFSATAGYALSERWQLNLTQGFSTGTGIADTAFGITFNLPMSKRLKLSTTVAATAPISKESKESFKTTTVMIGAGPTWQKGRWELSGKAYLAKSYYSKTVVIEEQTTDTATPLRLQEEPIDEHALEELGATGDREFDRYGAESEVAYRMAKRWQFGVGVGGAIATKQWGPTVYETEATIAQITYSFKALSTGLGFMMTAEGEQFQAPNTPMASFNVMYIFE